MRIGAVNSVNPVYGIKNHNSMYGKIASGNRIQQAKDDAAGLAIVNKMKKESNGLNVGAEIGRAHV